MKALTGPYLRMPLLGIWRPRIKAVSGLDTSCFHLRSRLCDGLAFLDEIEKEALVLDFLSAALLGYGEAKAKPQPRRGTGGVRDGSVRWGSVDCLTS